MKRKKLDWKLVWQKFNKRWRKYENNLRCYISRRTQQKWLKEIIEEQLNG